LEKGIASLVEEFIAAGRPSSREQSIDDRRNGYLASSKPLLFGGETTRKVMPSSAMSSTCTRVSVSPARAMTLEKGIASLVEEFIAAGRPSSREQSIDDRRNGIPFSNVMASPFYWVNIQCYSLVIAKKIYRIKPRSLRSLLLRGGHHRENRVLMTGETAISPAPFSQGKQKRGLIVVGGKAAADKTAAVIIHNGG
jgi:hypothetical protein